MGLSAAELWVSDRAEELREEHPEIAMDEAEIIATPEQLERIAGVIEGAHESYGQEMGHDVASTNLKAHRDQELEAVNRELEAERNKVVCPQCKGLCTTPTCWKCHGAGRL